jgi:hypothetical protein
MLGLEGIAKDYAQMELNNITQMKQLGLNEQEIQSNLAIKVATLAMQGDQAQMQALVQLMNVLGYDTSQVQVILNNMGGTKSP